VNIKNINQLVCYGFKNFHLGTAVRQNKNWNGKINIDIINKFAGIINNNE
jgi:hypothetical protein